MWRVDGSVWQAGAGEGAEAVVGVGGAVVDLRHGLVALATAAAIRESTRP